MSRTMIAAQQIIFGSLDSHCAELGQQIGNAGAPRWIKGAPCDSEFLARAVVYQVFRVTPRRIIARIDHQNVTYFVTLGFSARADLAGLDEGDLTPGIAAVFLAETSPRPLASPLKIRDVVEATDSQQDPEYEGHEFQDICDLFGTINVLQCVQIDLGETWKGYFEICISDLSYIDTWLEPKTIASIRQLTDLSSLGLPYQVLCRSLFDLDPAALFLALYRCLEALYAYKSVNKLASSLQIGVPWDKIAVALEADIGWRPREEDSLAGLFERCSGETLSGVFTSIGEHNLEDKSASAAAKRIYKLRNNIVHFRPIHHSIEFSNVNWNTLCESLSFIIREVYNDIFTSTAPENME